MSVISDTINLLVNINGNQAQNNLNELRKKAADLTYEMKNNLKKGTQEYITAAGDLRKVNADMTALKQSIGITALSMKELNAERKKLTTLVNSSTPLSKEFKDYNAQLQKVITRQNELRAQTTGTVSVISKQASEAAKGIGMLAKAYLGFSFLKQVVSDVGKFQDQLADLRRVTGLTATEAQNLNQALLSIDTRTSAEGLRNIAIIAGKLGVAKGDLLSFTQAVDKLVVSLGDELGNADEITTQLGKILNVFDGRINGDNISHLGNAIIELANAGVATGGFLVDFTQRVSGIAKASNLSLGATLGLAAGFESLGLRSESSSGALQQILTKIASDIPKAAKIAGVSVKQFNELFADKPQEALIQYAEGLAKNKETFAAVTSSFKDAEEKGIRVGQTLLAIASNSELLRKDVDLGSQSITRLSEQEEAFALKNDTVAGSLEKLKKEWDKLIDSKGVSNFLKGVTDELTGLVKALHKMEDAGFLKSFNRITEGFTTLINDGPKALIELNKQRKAADDFIEKFHEDQQKQGQIVAPGTPGALIFIQPKDTAPGPKAPNATNTNSTDTKSSTNAEYERLKKEAENFYKSLLKLKQDAANADKTQDEKDLIALQQKYEELHAKAIEYFKKNIIDRKTFNAEEKLIVESFQRELTNLQKKQFEVRSADEYAQALKDTQDYFDEQRNLEGQRYAEGKQSKGQYDAEIHALDLQEKAQLVQVAKDYSGTVKKAGEDETKFKKDQQKQQTDDAIAGAEARKKTAQEETLAAARLNVLLAPKNSSKRDEAQKKLLQAQFDLDPEIQKLDKNSKQYKEKEQELQDALTQIDKEGKQRRIQIAEEYVRQVTDLTANLIQALNNLDQRELNRDKKANDTKKNNYKKLLDEKLISQKQYDKLVAESDAQLDKKKQEIAVKQSKREKAQAIFDAIVNTAAAIVKALPNIPLSILAGVIGAAQIAAIVSTPRPEMGEGGLIKNGPYHSDKSGGLPLINPETGQTELLLEKNEGVLKGKAMRDKNQYTVTGTPSQIASRLNAMHGGVNWETGAVINVPKFRERPPQISARMPRIMAEGGLIIPMRNANMNTSSDQNVLLSDQNVLLHQLIDEVKNQRERLHAVVSIKEFKDTEKKYEAAKRASGLR